MSAKQTRYKKTLKSGWFLPSQSPTTESTTPAPAAEPVEETSPQRTTNVAETAQESSLQTSCAAYSSVGLESHGDASQIVPTTRKARPRYQGSWTASSQSLPAHPANPMLPAGTQRTSAFDVNQRSYQDANAHDYWNPLSGGNNFGVATFPVGARQPPVTARTFVRDVSTAGEDRRVSPNERRDIPARAPTISPAYSIN
jgi:hypothetical protein